jgi:hypothetical protein
VMGTESSLSLRPVRVVRPIAAPANEVWVTISAPGHLEEVHPFCKRNPVRRWPGIGSVDEVHYRSGWIYRRTFTDWIDGVGYDLEIGAEGEPVSQVSWRIAPVGQKACELAISVWPRPLTDIVVLQQLVRFTVVGPMMRRYLQSVTRGVGWFLTTGEPVSANQFGTHRWFSERT